MDERVRLESVCSRKATEGSNPSLTAKIFFGFTIFSDAICFCDSDLVGFLFLVSIFGFC